MTGLFALTAASSYAAPMNQNNDNQPQQQANGCANNSQKMPQSNAQQNMKNMQQQQNNMQQQQNNMQQNGTQQQQ